MIQQTLDFVSVSNTKSTAEEPMLKDCQWPQQLDLFDYFNGQTQASGMFEDRFGKIRRRFVVDISGVVEGDRLTLTENFNYFDGERATRVWLIDRLASGSYQGSAEDIVGTAEGYVEGPALRWQYWMILNTGRLSMNVKFDDLMQLMPGHVLLNRARVSKFGITLGTVSLSFSKSIEDLQ